jgi:hypothetical protein
MKLCLNCGKSEDLCECDFFEADEEGDDEKDELDGMRIKDETGADITDEELGGGDEEELAEEI